MAKTFCDLLRELFLNPDDKGIQDEVTLQIQSFSIHVATCEACKKIIDEALVQEENRKNFIEVQAIIEDAIDPACELDQEGIEDLRLSQVLVANQQRQVLTAAQSVLAGLAPAVQHGLSIGSLNSYERIAPSPLLGEIAPALLRTYLAITKLVLTFGCIFSDEEDVACLTADGLQMKGQYIPKDYFIKEIVERLEVGQANAEALWIGIVALFTGNGSDVSLKRIDAVLWGEKA